QIHFAQDDGGTRGGQRRRDRYRWQALRPPAALGARHGDGLSILRALPAYERRREFEIRPREPEAAQGRDCIAGLAGRRYPPDLAPPETPAEPAVWRPEPARRHRARHRQGAESLSLRR